MTVPVACFRMAHIASLVVQRTAFEAGKQRRPALASTFVRALQSGTA